MNNINSVFVKYGKGVSGNATNSFEKRLQRLEQIFYALTGALDSAGKNKQQIGGNGLENLISQIPAMQNGQASFGRSSGMPIVNSGNIQKNDKSNLVLSQGQVISELANAILRANQRNL